MNKNLIIILLSLSAMSFAASAQDKVYVSTDRNIYVAGDLVWCSAFTTRSSGVLYLELVSNDGSAARTKIAVHQGRGNGVISLPASMPTGNYRLIPYMDSEAESGAVDPGKGGKTISVFNTFRNDRVSRGVNVLPPSEYVALADRSVSLPALGDVNVFTLRDVDPGTQLTVTMENNSDDPVSMSLSVWHDDAVVSYAEAMPAFLAAGSDDSRSEHSEGEILKAVFVGKDSMDVADNPNIATLISCPGSAADTYTGKKGEDGRIRFYTNNIYGERNLVAEIMGMKEGQECHLEVLNPFLSLKGRDIPKLDMSSVLAGRLSDRSVAMQKTRTIAADTLYEFLPKRENLLLDTADCHHYPLVEYTRFQTVKDYLIEITHDIRVRKNRSGKDEIQVLLQDAVSDDKHFSSNVLVMLDGVPVTDHAHMLEFDATKLSDIYVYPHTYVFGRSTWSGLVNFVTEKRDMSALRFNENVSIVDFEGVSYPVAFTCEGLERGGEDLRQTLYWHPRIDLQPGETRRIDILTPSYQGTFKVVAEGFGSHGEAVRAESSFEVK